MNILSKVVATGMVPVFFHPEPKTACRVVETSYRAGVRAFEFTNRGEEAPDVFQELVHLKSHLPELALGIGTVMNPEEAETFVKIGADFIVSPILDKKVGTYCQSQSIPWIPGCATLTEIIEAVNHGAELVKIFPAQVLGPSFVKSVLGPCPDLKIMPTGGVKPTLDNLKAWFDAGVYCVGMGSQLFSREFLQADNQEQLSQKLRSTLEIIQGLRQF